MCTQNCQYLHNKQPCDQKTYIARFRIEFCTFKKNHEMQGVGKPPLAGGEVRDPSFYLSYRCLKLLVLWVQYNI